MHLHARTIFISAQSQPHIFLSACRHSPALSSLLLRQCQVASCSCACLPCLVSSPLDQLPSAALRFYPPIPR